MTRALTQTGRGRWFADGGAFQVTLPTPAMVQYKARPYAIREAKHGASAFVYVASLDQVPEAIEEYKNRKAVAVLTGQPMKHMWDWRPRTPRRKKADTGELFGQPARRARA